MDKKQQDKLIEALNSLDEFADMGANEEEKEKLANDYDLLFTFITEL